MKNLPDYNVEIEFLSIGPVSATSSTSGDLVVIDFLHLNDNSKALRLAFPSSKIQDFQAAISAVEKALADPHSGIHFQEKH